MNKQLVLVCLLSTLTILQAQITPQVQKHLSDLANSEIQKQLVNGSDNRNANLSAQVQRSFAKFVQAG